ncbi:MAG: GNAT family N-acetyltransferase [Bryobacterales bacterium]|nr:GNAT family N-acetyltransferase [Bryobacterales bacterium]
MSALSDASQLEILELRQIAPDDLEPLLKQESEVWTGQLHWDFTASADLVRRFVRMRSLSGFALRIRGVPAGYCYWVSEDEKGLIGDIYVLAEYAGLEYENVLMGAAVNAMMRNPHLRRIESQLMMLRPPIARELPLARYGRTYERNFMVAGLKTTGELPPGKASAVAVIDHWNEHWQEEAAEVIGSAYQGHVDSDINDQYRSVSGARRFLANIVQYPGCGKFFAPASLLAYRRQDGRLCGVCLASLVSRRCGHITQVCVEPNLQGAGIGYEMMRRSLQALHARGCREASLTVTSSNTQAIRLYERLGFVTTRTFGAYVWDGF